MLHHRKSQQRVAKIRFEVAAKKGIENRDNSIYIPLNQNIHSKTSILDKIYLELKH